MSSLEEIVREVDYEALKKDYVPSVFALKFINFVKMVGETENISPLFHYDILDTIYNSSNTLIVAYRGSGKSTLLELLVLYIAVFGELDGFGDVKVLMYVSDTMENGCRNFRANVEFRYRHSDFLQKYIVNPRFTDIELELPNISGHQLCVRMFGCSTGVRGFKKYGERPRLTLLDDLMSDKAAESKTIINDIENVVYKAARQAMHPTRRKMVWIGTPFNKKDPLYKAAGSTGWVTKAYPICQRFPCKKKEFIGAWEDRFPYESVKDEYDILVSTGRIDAFNQELMLRILSDDDRLVRDSDIVRYKKNELLENKKKYNWYITTDFATSEKEKSDFSVISVWALDHDGVFYWVDGIVKRQDMSKNVDDVFRFVNRYKPLSVGIEVSGQQKGFVSWLKREMNIRHTYFVIATDKKSGEEGLRPNTSKLSRFNIVLPLFRQRKIAFPEENSEEILEFLDELFSATPSGFKSEHDDCIDTISQISLLDYVVPSEDIEVSVNDPIDYGTANKYFKVVEELEEDTGLSSYIV